MDDYAYAKFYNERSQAGDTIILDNGGYEGAPIDAWVVCSELEPDIVVLPDFYLQRWQKTWHAAQAWLDKYADDIARIEFECLYIPQALPGDLHGFIESYQAAAEDERITWLGIPRCLATDIARHPLARVDFVRLVVNNHPHLKMHAFGMVNGYVHELPYLAHYGVRSVDSSAPVFRGLHNLSLTDKKDRKFWDEHGTCVDFSGELPKENYDWHSRILSNLEACGVDTNPTRG